MASGEGELELGSKSGLDVMFVWGGWFWRKLAVLGPEVLC